MEKEVTLQEAWYSSGTYVVTILTNFVNRGHEKRMIVDRLRNTCLPGSKEGKQKTSKMVSSIRGPNVSGPQVFQNIVAFIAESTPKVQH